MRSAPAAVAAGALLVLAPVRLGRLTGSSPERGVPVLPPALWVPETMHTALDLPLRCQPEAGMIRRWHYS